MPGPFSIMVSDFLAADRAPVEYTTEGKTRRRMVGSKIRGEVAPITGANPDQEVDVSNTGCRMGPDITIAEAGHGRVRACGRVWDFDGRSAEIRRIDWHGPN